jgi:DtxR family Mn-dependent transcriptional regulator
MALRRLKRDGYLDVKSDGIVCLTTQGRHAAQRTALRHHLIERMLSEMFGMPWYEVHDEAERLEHAVSPAFEALLLEKLGQQGTCPHGNSVLPESPARRARRGLRLLAEGEENSEYIVASLYERDPKLLRFLHESGVEPGGVIRILKKSYDQTIAIETPTGSATLGAPAAEKVWVKPLSAAKKRP